ncbi:DUF3995 domain-containing protein [Streptomyces sp. NPDC097619]|uniref:DUF3995 domain-containing protein n=1 Tax=Streptomyces sp. NPDC097619 TaxID=3157228 RepID=UPI003327012B
MGTNAHGDSNAGTGAGWGSESATGGRGDPGGAVAVGRGVPVAAALAATGLAAAGALHAVWLASPWPLSSRAELAEVVVGVAEAKAPPRAATAAVAGLLGAAAGLVLAAARPDTAPGRSFPVRAGVWTVAGVLGVRGAGGFVVSGLDLRGTPARFTRKDLTVYSPLCLGLAALSGYVARRTAAPAGRGRRPGPAGV